jgi:hypothetical protein
MARNQATIVVLGRYVNVWRHLCLCNFEECGEGREMCSFKRMVREPTKRDKIYPLLVRVKQTHYRPGQALRVPAVWGSQISRQSAHEGGKVFSPYTPAAFNPQEIHLVIISVGGWVDPRAIVRPEGLRHWKIPMTSSGMTFVSRKLFS